MATLRCPGQDKGFWDFSAIYDVKCPKCGYSVEFFKDEPTRICKKCAYEFVNPKMDFGCAAYCKYAEQCLGSLPTELLALRKELFKDRVGIEVKKYLRANFKKLKQVLQRVKYAEEILKGEIADPAVALLASYFYGLGSTPEESQIICNDILVKLQAKEELISEVCRLIEKNKAEEGIEGLLINYKILSDADKLTELEYEIKVKGLNNTEIQAKIDSELTTRTGKEIGQRFLK